MTDEQIERVITAMLPDLRIAIKGLLAGQSVHVFNCAIGTNSETGHKSKLVCFMAQEHPAIVLESTAKGIAEAQRLYIEQMKSLKVPWPRSVATS